MIHDDPIQGDSGVNSIPPLNRAASGHAELEHNSFPDHRPTQARIRVRINKDYHEEPIISRLVSHHGVTVNIMAALLGANARDDGWFDLELRGTADKIRSALIYLAELDLEIWQDTDRQQDGW